MPQKVTMQYVSTGSHSIWVESGLALDSCMTYDGAAVSFKGTDATRCCVHVMNITVSS